MRKKVSKMAGIFLTLLLFFCLTNVTITDANRYQLKQVLVLSRHNVRTPLTANLEKTTPKKWPKWNDKVGHLTSKGVLLEQYMGGYFSQWLQQRRLLTEECPSEDVAYIYANTRQRTKESAKAFVKGAFKNCNINVNFKNIEEMDPIFNPIIHNSSAAFKRIVLNDMQNKLDELQLNETYKMIEKMIDFKNSKVCKSDGICDLVNEENDILFEVGKEPNVAGPLQIGNSVVDSFLMEYYDGMSTDEVAWGEIKNTDQWKLLTQITEENLNVRFNTTILAKDAAKLLIKYVSDIFLDEAEIPKFTLLFGHDSNLFTVMAAMGFQPYALPDQYEKTPIGGKLVYQKWYDVMNDRDLLKVEYIYQSTSQLRDAVKLSLDNPPKNVIMEIRDCKVDENGYCLWSDFVKLLKSLQ